MTKLKAFLINLMNLLNIILINTKIKVKENYIITKIDENIKKSKPKSLFIFTNKFTLLERFEFFNDNVSDFYSNLFRYEDKMREILKIFLNQRKSKIC
jgi:hypothetical protein